MSNIKNRALLVMDVQIGIVDRLENKNEYLEKLKNTVDSAHMKNIPVVYVVAGFRPGFPEISLQNKTFSRIREALSDYPNCLK
jgi:nicotinamidase-related amidase